MSEWVPFAWHRHGKTWLGVLGTTSTMLDRHEEQPDSCGEGGVGWRGCSKRSPVSEAARALEL